MLSQRNVMLCVLPEVLPGPDGGNGDTGESERVELLRKKAIRVYFAMSIIQVISGLITFACSSIAVHYHSGGGFPYYIGSFVIGGMLLVASMIAFRVYNKGPLFTTCEVARKEVLCALNMHRGVSFFMFFGCIFGVAIIWMYGLCVMEETECSYTEHITKNKTIAIIVFVLGFVGLITSAVGMALVRKYGQAFGLLIVTGRSGGLRYVGFSGDVVQDLQRQNAEIQRRLQNQNNYPHMPSGCSGFTNFGFEPPTPPPYSPTAVETSVVGGMTQTGLNPQTIDSSSPCSIPTNPPKYSDIEPSVIPSEPPPAYKETDDRKSENDQND